MQNETTALQSVTALLRRLYLHVQSGARITPDDLSRVITMLEKIDNAR